MYLIERSIDLSPFPHGTDTILQHGPSFNDLKIFQIVREKSKLYREFSFLTFRVFASYFCVQLVSIVRSNKTVFHFCTLCFLKSPLEL